MGCVPFCQRTEPSPAGLPAGPSSSQEGWMAGSSPAMTDRALPDRRAARADECRGVAERAGLFEPLGEVLDARFVRALTGRRGARPLNRGNGLDCRSLGLLLSLAPERRVADQELQAVVAERKLLLTVPQRHQFRFLEAEVAQHDERLFLQLRSLRIVRHVRDLLLEEIVLALGEFGEMPELLLRLPVLGREHVLGDVSNLLLLQVPEQVTRPVFTG